MDKVPYRTPFGPIKELQEYFENKNIIDLGCRDGDLMNYINNNLNCSSICGVELNKFNNKYNLNIISNNMLNINLSNYDTYFIWIERPDIETKVIQKIINENKNDFNIIIAYNTKGSCKLNKNILKTNYFNIDCKFCKYLRCIPDKMNKLQLFLTTNKINYNIKKYNYNDGDSCRQQGEFTYYIIN